MEAIVTDTTGVCNRVAAVSFTTPPPPPLFNKDDPTDEDDPDDPSLPELLLVVILVPTAVVAVAADVDTPTEAAAALKASLSTIDWIRFVVYARCRCGTGCLN